MKGLFLRIIAAFALLLWAIDMVFPWQKNYAIGAKTLTPRSKIAVALLSAPLTIPFTILLGMRANLAWNTN